jgi:hypothetical protein
MSAWDGQPKQSQASATQSDQDQPGSPAQTPSSQKCFKNAAGAMICMNDAYNHHNQTDAFEGNGELNVVLKHESEILSSSRNLRPP